MNRKLGWAAVLLAVWGASVAGATTLVAADVPSLSRTADRIVQATVSHLESRWTGDHLRIITEVTLDVSETLKGSASSQVRVIQPGGIVGDVGQRVSGLASFEPGEEVVVFLQQRAGDSFLVAGMAQGKFKVDRSSDGKAAFALQDSLGDARVLDPRTGQPSPAPARNALPPTLDALKAQIRQSIAAPVPEPSTPTRPTRTQP